ncbi:MAG: ribokinase [Acidobacteria bacterium]|nr:MAG: ribokinase [Acidobacteriota bacterium]
MTKRIVIVGSINLDLVASADRVPVAGETISGQTFQTFFGGKGANQAVAVARLRYPVSMVAKVGDDTFGPQLRKALRDAGVDVKAVKTVKGSSGVALIATGSRGENSIIVIPGANGKVLPRDLDHHKSLITSAGMLLTQLESPLETVEYLGRLAKKFDVPLMLDPAPARSLPEITPNETETRILLGANQELEPARAADELRARGARNVVLKLGDKGAYVATADGQRAHIPAFPVRPVDTTAAGDAFNGAFAVALLQGKAVTESARYACAVAAISVTRAGAQPSMPSRSEVQKFLKQHSHGQSASAG